MKLLALGAVLTAVGGYAINWMIMRQAAGRIFGDAATAPENDVALVLGTAPTAGEGRWKNPFFESRMDAAATLFRAGKVRHLLVSGDNGRREYDEPTAMQSALPARGIPESAITLDYAGFRTLDSVVRARAVFGQTKLTIVTDDFHLPRALFWREPQDSTRSVWSRNASLTNGRARRGRAKSRRASQRGWTCRCCTRSPGFLGRKCRSRSRVWIDQSRGCATRTVTS